MKKVNPQEKLGLKAGTWINMMEDSKYQPEKHVFAVLKETLAGEDLKGRNILDAGCGEGRYGQYMKKMGGIVTGIDVSARLLKVAMARLDKVQRGVIQRLPFETSSFDLVTCFMVLMLLTNLDLQQAFKEFYRVLNSSGKLLFSTIHPCFESWGIGQSFPFKNADEYFQGSKRCWTANLADGSIEEGQYFHRPLEAYFKAMEGLFVVRRLWEPRTNKNLQNGKHAHAEFLIMEVVKTP